MKLALMIIRCNIPEKNIKNNDTVFVLYEKSDNKRLYNYEIFNISDESGIYKRLSELSLPAAMVKNDTNSSRIDK